MAKVGLTVADGCQFLVSKDEILLRQF